MEFSPLNGNLVQSIPATSATCIITRCKVVACDEQSSLDIQAHAILYLIAVITLSMHFIMFKSAFRTRDEKFPPLVLIDGRVSPAIQRVNGIAVSNIDVQRNEFGNAIQLASWKFSFSKAIAPSSRIDNKHDFIPAESSRKRCH